jgi:hypothetical protein
MDNKTIATIFLRVLGIWNLVFGILYAPYLLLTAAYNGTFILAGFLLLSYFGSGIVLLFLSDAFAGLVIKGLKSISPVPPSPPTFDN